MHASVRSAIRPAADARVIACAVILGLFVLAAASSAARKDLTRGFDEVAHASYVAEVQRTRDAWPAPDSLRMLDPATLLFTREPNYLNHPPLYYDLLALFGPTIEGNARALFAHRFLNIGIAALGLMAALAIAVAARFPRLELYAYASPLVTIPILVPIAGAINNDNAAFTGGMIVSLAAFRLVATGRTAWLWLALAGMIVAAWAKLTGLLLTGTLLAGVFAWLAWRRRLPVAWMIASAGAVAIAALPYLIYIAQYGSPAPDTPALAAMLRSGAQATGWAEAERLTFAAYGMHFLVLFVSEWMPTLAPRGAVHYAMLAFPVAFVLCGLAGLGISLHRIARREETALHVIVMAGFAAIAATFALHLHYSYAHHVATGWMLEAYPRYYLPIAAIVPLGGIAVLGAIRHPRGRIAVTSFLIVAPILFEMFGAPLP